MRHIEQVNIALKYGKICKELNCSLAKSSSFLTPYDKIKQDLTNLFYTNITKYINTVICISMYFPPFLTDEEKIVFRQFLYDYIDLINFKNLDKNSEAFLNFCKLYDLFF